MPTWASDADECVRRLRTAQTAAGERAERCLARVVEVGRTSRPPSRRLLTLSGGHERVGTRESPRCRHRLERSRRFLSRARRNCLRDSCHHVSGQPGASRALRLGSANFSPRELAGSPGGVWRSRRLSGAAVLGAQQLSTPHARNERAPDCTATSAWPEAPCFVQLRTRSAGELTLVSGCSTPMSSPATRCCRTRTR